MPNGSNVLSLSNDFTTFNYGNSVHNIKPLYSPSNRNELTYLNNKQRELQTAEPLRNQQVYDGSNLNLSIQQGRNLQNNEQIDFSNPNNVINIANDVNYNIYASSNGKYGEKTFISNVSAKKIGESVYSDNNLSNNRDIEKEFRYSILQKKKREDYQSWKNVGLELVLFL